MAYRSFPANNSLKQLTVTGKHVHLTHNKGSQLSPLRIHFPPSVDRESISEFSAQLLRSSVNTPVNFKRELSPNTNQWFGESPIFNKGPKNTNILFTAWNTPQLNETGNLVATPGRDPGKLRRATTTGDVCKINRAIPRRDMSKIHRVTPKGDLGNFSAKNVRQPALLIQNYGTTEGQERTILQGEQTCETAGRDISSHITPLTEQNLIVFNKITPPLKGDYRTIVSTWLEKSVH